MERAEALSPQAVKFARRIQWLPDNRAYVITIFKASKKWLLSIQDDKGTKIEELTDLR